MKKLLVLLMVLGMVSSANAALSLYLNNATAPSSTTIAIDEVISIGAYSSDTEPWTGFIELNAASGIPDVTTFASLDFASGVATGIGELGSITTDFYADGSAVKIVVGSTTGAVIAGQQYKLNLKGLAAGDCLIGLYNASENTIQTMTVTVTPEPMTMALLGLGGLFLRRKK